MQAKEYTLTLPLAAKRENELLLLRFVVCCWDN